MTEINLQQILVDYRQGKRELPTYDELVQFDNQLATAQARAAALRHSLLQVVHEQAAVAYLVHIQGIKDAD